MRLLIQRVKYGSVKVESKNYFQSIGKGLVVFVGFTHSDTLSQVDFLCNKLLNLRIFEDEKKKMNLSIQDINGEILLISQFTLYANTSKGNRPGFDLAMNPAQAENLYNEFAQRLQAWNSERVRLGIFGEEMLIEIHNDGPVTILLEKE
ncbi:MAG: D-aminoacyl-tRNA deacylase [Leptospiraceae bacterium]|nr:D-aminoacyl-tRNA deacylase [Leptospiraceae bacterium]